MYLQSCQTFYIRTADFWFAKCHCMGYNIFICESAAILRERRARMEQNEQQLMKLEGTVEHVIYENADTGLCGF